LYQSDFKQHKKEIVDVMKLELGGNGHWFKCPNGHYYVIGDCGGAMETAICPECKAEIGGGHHKLLTSNKFAPEMDNEEDPNSVKTAWPTMMM